MSEQRYPFDAIDLGFMLLAPSHPVLLALCIAQYWARRSPLVVRALLDVGAALPTDERTVALLPGLGKLQIEQAARESAPPVPQLVAPAATQAAPPALNLGRLARIDEGRAAPRALAGATTIEEIADLDNIWVVGPKGSGKTTVLRRLLQLRRGQHIALDPHATPGKWGRAKIIGGGREYDAIRRALLGAVGVMDKRYKAQAAGEITEEECKAARRTLVGDEWMSVADNIPARRGQRGEDDEPGAADQMITILTEGRKAGVCVLAASHADTATAMGVSGKKDVLKCYDRVIYLGAMAVERWPAAAQMERPAVAYDPERRTFTPLIVTLPAEAAPAPAADDPLLGALLGGEPSAAARAAQGETEPMRVIDSLTDDELRRLDIARELAPELGKTKAINAAFRNPSGPKYQRYARAFDQAVKG